MPLKDKVQNLTSSLAQKADEVLHKKDNHNSATTSVDATTTGTTSTTTSNAVDNPASTNYGPHSSNLANKADPTVDSNLDSRNSALNTSAGTTQSVNTTNTTNTTYDNPKSTNAGPHDSNVMNKLDPRVDSDRDRIGGLGSTQTDASYGNTSSTTGANTLNDTYATSNLDNPQSSNNGPHSSNLLNKLDPRVDSDRDGRNAASSIDNVGNPQASNNQGYGTASTTTTGASSSSYGNPGSTNAGPHSSNLANKLDPRVDSDLDGRNNPTSTFSGTGNTQTAGLYTDNSSTAGTTFGSNTTTYDNPQSTNAGPHSSNLANKLDPRVDSDLDSRNNPTSTFSGSGNAQTTGSYSGNSSTIGTTSGSNTASYNNPQSTNAGPHSSNLANKLDPRVDSDLDGRNNPTSTFSGTGNPQTTTSGLSSQPNQPLGSANTSSYAGNPQSTNNGPHSSNLLNKLDPRVDSDRDGRDNPASYYGGAGNTQPSTTSTYGNTLDNQNAAFGNTATTGANPGFNNPNSTNAGPHDSNLLNKLDPRVDSNPDGSNVRTAQY